MIVDVTSAEHLRTDRLRLDRMTLDDVESLHELHADPAVWAHYPSGRHASRDQTDTMVERAIRDWDADALGYWSVRELGDDRIVGMGGCARRREGRVWNLAYRLSPSVWGRGYARELSVAAVEAARAVDAAPPVTAFLLEHNEASRRTAESVGLALVWKGPDAGNPDPEAVRLILADRELDSETLDLLTRA